MATADQPDPQAIINAVSDVIQNRPLPLREFDQIYMKAGDMVLQTQFVARRFDKKKVIFIGDGDGISLCLAHLKNRGLVAGGPQEILVLDFDERMVNAITRFADTERIDSLIHAELYNCIDPLPKKILGNFDVFYTNPPWGASNEGESVKVFAERGMEAVGRDGEGIIVIADDPELIWARDVLFATQTFAAEKGFYVQEMQSRLHRYHLDDAPDLRSCNLILRARPDRQPITDSQTLMKNRLENFYGREKVLRVRYVREKARLEYGKAPEETYSLDLLKD